jgi:hypothetical protein
MEKKKKQQQQQQQQQPGCNFNCKGCISFRQLDGSTPFQANLQIINILS